MSLKKENHWQYILFGIVALLCSWFMYEKLSAYESGGEGLSLPLVLMLTYDFFGKSAPSGILAIGGLISIVSGILSIRNQKKWDVITAENNKPKFISFSDDLQFEIIRKLSDDFVNYFERLNIEIKEGQIYKHYWTDSVIYENENDENFLNMSTYFWKADLPFLDTLLPDFFKNYQNLEFRFLNHVDHIKSEKISNDVEKYYYEEENKKIRISKLLERDIIEYCEIQTLENEDINDLKYYEDELYFVIVNSKIRYLNNELYIDTNPISIEIAYSIGAIELVRTKKKIFDFVN